MKPWVWLTVSWFGLSGKFNRIRGTWGTLATLPLAFIVQYTMGNIALAIVGCALFILGVIASEHYVKETNKEDPGEIIIDEVAATCVLIAFLPLSMESYIAAFFVFRIFDIVKPWPVSLADKKCKGGFGVMFDDMLAALYPVLLMAILYQVKPELYEKIMSWLQMNAIR